MDQHPATGSVSRRIPRVRVLTFIILFLFLSIGIGLGARFYVFNDLNLIHSVLISFLSLNILICYWEGCLFFRRSLVEERTEYWRQWKDETGGTPHAEFFTSKIPWSHVFSPTIWADVWATYSQFDASFANRKTYGFNVDVGNAFASFAPTLILYVTLTIHFLPAYVVGILGIMMFWQWTYMTSVYWVSFFVAKRHAEISRRDLYLYVFGTNLPWVACPLLGLYAAIRLVVDGNFSVLL